jgi:hypothetical protein
VKWAEKYASAMPASLRASFPEKENHENGRLFMPFSALIKRSVQELCP